MWLLFSFLDKIARNVSSFYSTSVEMVLTGYSFIYSMAFPVGMKNNCFVSRASQSNMRFEENNKQNVGLAPASESSVRSNERWRLHKVNGMLTFRTWMKIFHLLTYFKMIFERDALLWLVLLYSLDITETVIYQQDFLLIFYSKI